jgi:1-deoxy-D-xylulose-5-phosphate reductoisomerase
LKKSRSFIIPVDSEHSAIFQCMKNESKEYINRIIITGSGGPFFRLRRNQKVNYGCTPIGEVTIKQALKHPKWRMGKKITIDSATLMNKGFEIIEAHYLFNIPLEKISLLIHPESVVHSMVEFTDGATIALLSVPDMKLSIQYALTYPERYPTGIKTLELDRIKSMSFYLPDYDRFPCIKLALESIRIGGSMPAVLNAANEVAVELFLSGRIKFSDIAGIVEFVMNEHKVIRNPSLEDIFAVDKWSREVVLDNLEQ